jgi:hypothetical protein
MILHIVLSEDTTTGLPSGRREQPKSKKFQSEKKFENHT